MVHLNIIVCFCNSICICIFCRINWTCTFSFFMIYDFLRVLYCKKDTFDFSRYLLCAVSIERLDLNITMKNKPTVN